MVSCGKFTLYDFSVISVWMSLEYLSSNSIELKMETEIPAVITPPGNDQ